MEFTGVDQVRLREREIWLFLSLCVNVVCVFVTAAGIQLGRIVRTLGKEVSRVETYPLQCLFVCVCVAGTAVVGTQCGTIRTAHLI